MWQRTRYITTGIILFQSTHPRRVWRLWPVRFQSNNGFNPHTHAGCDAVNNFFELKSNVSIHTPTQGVTLRDKSKKSVSSCFNPHTHAGCDITVDWVGCIWASFNPHTHAGCDRAKIPKRNASLRFQSTHPRRVWLRAGTTCIPSWSFQSTHPRRVWLIAVLSSLRADEFQSTHPRRVWQTVPELCCWNK